MIQKLYTFFALGQNPYENIATEKYLLENVEPGSCILYLWQNQNTVVIGRNQNPWVECRTALLEEEGGHLARRLSGGGAVFHDLGNLNFTFLMADEDYDLDRQLSVIQEACAMAGIQTQRSGRNDLLAQEQKFSGNAFYHSHGKAYHHGTLLIHADMEKLGRYLTPSKAKLEAKGVASVRSRVVNLQTLSPDLTCEQMRHYMCKAFGLVYGADPEVYSLTEEAMAVIQKDTAALSSWDWLFGTRLAASFGCEDRFSWGGIRVELKVESGHIQALEVYTDAMDWSLPTQIKEALTGCRFSVADIDQALGQDPVSRDIATLLRQAL